MAEAYDHRSQSGEDEAIDSPDSMESQASLVSPAGNDGQPSTMDDTANIETCRICRSEATVTEPLFYPCKCSGSIKWVHQECLMEWLSHSHKKHCELCKTPFRFTKLYDADMPERLPWTVFVKRACVHLAMMVGQSCRAVIVGVVWLVILPWLIRWAWRWMFWVADAGWARETFLWRNGLDNMLQPLSEQTVESHNHTSAPPRTAWPFEGDALIEALSMLESVFRRSNESTELFDLATLYPSASSWPRADASILSSWTYLSELTSNPVVNRCILDIFEGQLITCVVIVGFILVFLIREWVVQQQPLVHADNLNALQAELDRHERHAENLRRQAELLELARAHLAELRDEQETQVGDGEVDVDRPSGLGSIHSWESLAARIDEANDHLRIDGDNARIQFVAAATNVLDHLRTDGAVTLDDGRTMSDKAFDRLRELPMEEQRLWQLVLLGQLRKDDVAQSSSQMNTSQETGDQDGADNLQLDSAFLRRPRMPERDASSVATRVQRVLQEGEVTSDTTEIVQAGSSGFSTGDGNQVKRNTWWSALGRATISPSEDEYDIMPIANAGPEARRNIKRAQPKASTLERNASAPSRQMTAADSPQASQHEREHHNASDDDTAAPAPLNPHSLEDEVEEPASDDNESAMAVDGSAQGDDSSWSLPRATMGEDSETDRLIVPVDDGTTIEELVMQQGSGDQEATIATTRAEVQGDIRPAAVAEQRGVLHRVMDWFWGDIEVNDMTAEAHAADENNPDHGHGHEAPFAPPRDRPLPGWGHAIDPGFRDELDDDNVAQRAAGLGNDGDQDQAIDNDIARDADAIEDAEDLEGIFELVGLQGPLIGLLQTSCFCCVLVTGTILAAVVLPYLWGKFVLILLQAPVTLIIKAPLRIASFIADTVFDSIILVSSWVLLAIVFFLRTVLVALKTLFPSMREPRLLSHMLEYAAHGVSSFGERVYKVIAVGQHSYDNNLNWMILRTSMQAHASLRGMQNETNAILNYTSNAITAVVDTVSGGSSSLAWREVIEQSLQTLRQPQEVLDVAKTCMDSVSTFVQLLLGLKSARPMVSDDASTVDAALVFWSSGDRFLAVVTGYLALAALATIYVAVDTPFTRSDAGQRTEKLIRDTLRQAGGVFKVILIISIEMLVFPLYCGILLDIAFLPLFRNSSLATRWAFALRSPYTFFFVHWFVGTCYMFHFALFVGMCRKILRRGVLWFIRDPDDPTFHPVRDVLERNVTTQLRKIAFSALVYGALVILCLGGVIWSIGHMFTDLFPVHWLSTEPVLEFPIDLLLYNFATPVLIRLFRPSDAVHAMYAWWLQQCARPLRLSHFLFNDERKVEQGVIVHKTWLSFFIRQQPTFSHGNAVPSDDIDFTPNGRYVLTPCNDQYRPPKANDAFLHIDGDNLYVADKDGKRSEHFAKVYIPPNFKFRVTMFMVCLWIFSVFVGLCSTLLPLVLGRGLMSLLVPSRTKINDIYAFSIGAYILVSAIYLGIKGQAAIAYMRARTPLVILLQSWTRTMIDVTKRVAECVYIYGFVGIVMPVIFSLMLQLYLIVPLHTYLVSVSSPLAHAENNRSTATNTTAGMFHNNTVEVPLFMQYSIDGMSGQQPKIASHTVHLLGDYALGLLYVRIAMHFMRVDPASRAGEAIRQIVADGYLRPNAWLATKFFVIPALLLMSIFLMAPPGLACLCLAGADWQMGESVPILLRTLVYRYSYPVTAGTVLISYGANLLAKATQRWRARIRDEVYLVGERLHNFGEKKPPAGSRSVVRKDK